MSDAIRAILTLILFLIAFPALYIVFKAADPQLKAIVGAAVFLFPCFLLLGEDLVRSEKSTGSRRLERDRATWVSALGRRQLRSNSAKEHLLAGRRDRVDSLLVQIEVDLERGGASEAFKGL
jgi:hypothetical protein